MHRVSSDQEHDTNVEKVQSASKKRMEIDAGIGTKSYQEQVCEGPRRLLSLDQSRDNYNRHNSYRAWTWLEIHASLRLLNLPISLTPSVVPWAQFLVFWLFLLLPWPCSQPALLALSQVCIVFVWDTTWRSNLTPTMTYFHRTYSPPNNTVLTAISSLELFQALKWFFWIFLI